MNFLYKHIGLFFLIVLFATVENSSFANLRTSSKPSDNYKNSSFLTESESEKPVEFHKFSLIKLFETVSPQEYSGVGLSALHTSVEHIEYSGIHSFFIVDYLQDQRRLLSRFLYPFFFFW